MTIPSHMTAAILTQQHQPLVLDEVQLPQQLSHGQVLVEIHYSGICGSQLGEIEGVKGEDKYLPHLLGHEGSGVVRQIGSGVKTVQAGNRVVLHWMKGSGLESELPNYQWQGRPLNAGWVTTFNEYAIVSENRLTVIPADMDLEMAALFGCAVTTGFGVINNNLKLKIGESLVVLGAGGVGLSIIQGAALVTAHPIVAVDLFEHKLNLAKDLGATHILNGQSENLEAEIRQIVGDRGADAVVDNTGQPHMIELAYRVTQPQGKTVLVGVPRLDHRISIYSLPLHFGKTLTGSHGGESRPEHDIPRYIRLVQNGQLDLKPLITARFPLGKINDAIALLQQGKISGRCLIHFAHQKKDGY